VGVASFPVQSIKRKHAPVIIATGFAAFRGVDVFVALVCWVRESLDEQSRGKARQAAYGIILSIKFIGNSSARGVVIDLIGNVQKFRAGVVGQEHVEFGEGHVVKQVGVIGADFYVCGKSHCYGSITIIYLCSMPS